MLNKLHWKKFMAVIELSKEEIIEYIYELYSCFNTGREFEMFLNSFLTKIGFEEVVTTQYVGDQGIDLTCLKRGFDFNGTDTINYYIQAKRYAYNNKVQAKEIRDLKGTTKRDRNGNILNNNYVNIFITTSSFTAGAIKEATENPNMPVITIDGEKLISLCIENKIGFNFKPVFSKNDILNLVLSNKENNHDTNDDYLVDRQITQNDIRARILVIPQVIKDFLNKDGNTFEIVVNGVMKTLSIDKSRRYFGGITEIYRHAGLLTKDNTYVSKLSRWKINGGKLFVDII